MISISLCMIVKNEEDVLSRCLETVKDLVDEIIIVDTGSNDSTIQIAEKYTKKVYYYKWNDNFADARNYAFSKATKEFCMWLDADDVFLETDREKFRLLKKELNESTDMVMMNYNVAFDDRGRATFSYNRERLVRRERAYQWVGAIHEIIEPKGNIIYSDVSVSHKKLHPTDPNRNIKIFEKMIADGKELDARQQFYYSRELSYHQRYEEAIKILKQFLDEGKGWIENNINACMDLAEYYRAIHQEKEILPSLCRSFEYDVPRAEVCCAIGDYFFERDEIMQAIFWYTTASTRKQEKTSNGFQLKDCYDFIPYLQLCVCFDKIGDKKTAEAYHKKSQLIKPDNSNVLYNEKYFQSLQVLKNEQNLQMQVL